MTRRNQSADPAELAERTVRSARSARSADGPAKRGRSKPTMARAGRIVPDGIGDRIPGPGHDQYPTSPLGERVKGIPTGRDVEWQPLVDYRRYGVSETTIHGAVAWAHGRKVIHSWGGNVLCYGRSMMKPLVMKVFADELADCSWEQKAIAQSSHNGDTEHVAAAQSLLHETEWGLMQAPLDLPLVPFGRTVRRPRRWYHPCSGEHAAILHGCKKKGWPRIGYLLPQHPWFQAYVDEVRGILSPDGKSRRDSAPRRGNQAGATGSWEPIRIARDGCGLPTLSNTVNELAILYAHLAATKDEDWVWDAYQRNPDLVGGFNRLDTTILKSCGGKVVAKEGADGLLGLAIDHPDYPEGLGIVIKIAHGWNPRATWYVARSILGVLGFRLRNPYPLSRQKAFIVPGVVPPKHVKQLEGIASWDEWDPDTDRWYYDWHEYVGSQPLMRGHASRPNRDDGDNGETSRSMDGNEGSSGSPGSLFGGQRERA